MTRTGARVLVDQLLLHGVDTVFCVPGESYLAALDAFRDVEERIRLVVCRHEGGAAVMAEAYGKLTGRPGVCFVTRAPGATNASIALHTAFQDSTPLVLLVGQVPRAHRGREAFQEVDYSRLLAEVTKWTAEASDPRRLPELVARAFQLALSGRPGPVALALPQDVLDEECDAADAAPIPHVEAAPAPGDLARVRELVLAAKRPLVLVGGGLWSALAAHDLASWAEEHAVPVCASFRRQHYLDNDSPAYCGYAGVAMDASVARLLRECDALLALGTRLGDATTRGYSLLAAPDPGKPLVHVYPDPDELGRVYRPSLGVVASPPAFAAALRREPAGGAASRRPWAEAARATYLATLEPPDEPGELSLGSVVAHLRERLPPDAVITNGAGNFTIWLQRYYRFRRFGTQLGPTSGAMGYGVPAAVAAKLVHPERAVVCFSGDGDFLMTGQELATAMQAGTAIVVLVVNNGMYGTIRMHQERAFPGRIVATDLVNPDFAAYARAFGAHGELVERTADFPAAFERALAAGRPALLDLRVDPRAIAPGESLSQVRSGA